MTISANTVIHFTGDKESLKGILASGFSVFLCKETIVMKEVATTKYIPMISFCDIPISQAKDHLTKYGNYGIGLSMDWAVKNKLNPVLYMSRGSTLSQNVRSALNYYKKREPSEEEETEYASRLMEIVRYMKNYEGPLQRKGKAVVENYRFYDEREWRYVPEISEFGKMMLTEVEFNNPIIKDKVAAKIAKMKLGFHANEIKYIIINSDEEIHEFIRHLKDVKGDKYSMNDVEKLTTRIITADQIKTDL